MERWKDGKKFFNGQSACVIHSPIIDHDNDDTLSNVIAACSVQSAASDHHMWDVRICYR